MSNGRKTVNTAIGDDIFEEFYLRGWIAKGPDDFGFVSTEAYENTSEAEHEVVRQTVRADHWEQQAKFLEGAYDSLLMERDALKESLTNA